MTPNPSTVATGWLKQIAVAGFIGLGLLASPALAVDILVTSDADSGPGTLREAMTAANSGDRIVFDIAGIPTIQLLSDLPVVTGDIAFDNVNPTDVTIDRNGNNALNFQSGSVDVSTLNVIDTLAGGPPDIQGAADSTFYGASRLSGNITLPGTLAPGASPDPGVIGTFDLTGDLDATGATFQLDLESSGGPTQNDLVDVDGVLTVTGGTLAPNFVGDSFSRGQSFLVIDSTNPIVGAFANEATAMQISQHPFLEAIANRPLAGQLAFDIQDNGATFASIAEGCNQLSAAQALDAFYARVIPPAGIDPLRDGSSAEVAMAINQLSGSIYGSLISAELNHIQGNLTSIRDRIAGRETFTTVLVPWVRGYGVSSTVETDKCRTPGYRHEIGGAEMGLALRRGDGIAAFVYSHLADSSLYVRGVDQSANVASYRVGGGLQYVGQGAYVFMTGGGGTQDYDVRRSLSAFAGSTFAESSFDGSSGFGYLEIGLLGGDRQSAYNPFIAIQGAGVEIDGIAETGDAEFALQNGGASGESLRSILGMSWDQVGATPIGPARSRLRVGWLHDYLDTVETIQSVFADTNPTPITVQDSGVDTGRDWAMVGYELDWAMFRNGQLAAGYQGHFNSRSAFNSFLIGLQWVR